MQSFDDKLKQALDDKTASLGAATLSRLHRARIQALETPTPWWRQPAAYAGATASIAVMMAYVLLSRPDADHGPVQPAISSDAVEVLEIINLEVDLDLVEDLDFYRWLAQQQNQRKDA